MKLGSIFIHGRISIRTSLWFLPTVLVVAFVALAGLLLDIETRFGLDLANRWPRIFGAGAEGARGMLSAIASSMITVAGVSFSITIVTLALASSQYSPRVLRNFMRDWHTQTVLGTLLGTFCYCLVVLRTIRAGEDGDSFVPSLAVTGGVALGFIGVGALIFFLHHIATSIQASGVIRAAMEETLVSLIRVFPSELGEEVDPPGDEKLEDLDERAWRKILSLKTGYVEGVNSDALLSISERHSKVLRMERGVGDFVIEGTPLASVRDRFEPSTAMKRELNSAYSIGKHRTGEQDPGYGIRQIVDIALKALSPGVNDTTTAEICVDHLGAVLCRISRTRFESRLRTREGALRVIARGPSFESLVSECFDQIRQNARKNPAILEHLLCVIEIVLQQTRDSHRQTVLRMHAQGVFENAKANLPESDLGSIVRAFDRLTQKNPVSTVHD